MMIEEVEDLIASFNRLKPIKEPDNPFDVRRIRDPQGAIDDLLKQSIRQAKTIHEKNQEIAKLAKELAKLTKKMEKANS